VFQLSLILVKVSKVVVAEKSGNVVVLESGVKSSWFLLTLSDTCNLGNIPYGPICGDVFGNPYFGMLDRLKP
jgi:hypothetical protein